jgi:predicted glycosyl hydrolase (DUF1957 family)
LNIPLSLIEQFDKYGYGSLIVDIKDLVDSERVELTGSASYHALLTRLSTKNVENEIILNEYGLGYYFGSHHGFEGEPAILLRNVAGFFPPELSVNDALCSTLSGLGYSWVLVDSPAIPFDEKPPVYTGGIYTLPDQPIKIVCRDTSLSNLIAFKREPNLDDILSYVRNHLDADFLVIALDGETFGHHYNEGIYLLDVLIGTLQSLGIEIDLLSNIVADENSSGLSSVVESSWGTSAANPTPFPYWVSESNALQQALWQLHFLVDAYAENFQLLSDPALSETTPVWKETKVPALSHYINTLRFLNSDKFWWLSGKTLPDNTVLLNKPLVCRCLELIPADATSDILALATELRMQLK